MTILIKIQNEDKLRSILVDDVYIGANGIEVGRHRHAIVPPGDTTETLVYQSKQVAISEEKVNERDPKKAGGSE